jgi:hypothetical protein
MSGKSLNQVWIEMQDQRQQQAQRQAAEERAIKERVEQSRREYLQKIQMYERSVAVSSSAAAAGAGAGGSKVKLTPSEDKFIAPPPSPGQTLYYIRLIDTSQGNAIMFTGFFYVDDATDIVQTFYDSTNSTVDIRSTGSNGGPTYLYEAGWLCFDGGGCNITSFPYLYGASIGDYNLYGNVNSSTGNNVDGYGNVTFEFNTIPFFT